MLDFVKIATRIPKKGIVEVYPKFLAYCADGKRSTDLMIRGGDFYAVWDDNRKIWCTDEVVCFKIIDKMLSEAADKMTPAEGEYVRVLHMWDADSGMIDKWHKFCQKQMRDNWHPLDETIIFSNTDKTKELYASKSLEYPLAEGSTEAYDKLMGVLYSESELHKLNWALGAIVSGESRFLQKFIVLYGSSGTGKSTFLNIVQKLFDGYYTVFDAKALGMSNSAFALEPFMNNPLVAIQHDGDLSRIEDNTRLNSLVSHEEMTVNAKYTKLYSQNFKAFLFMGTNKPVKITDGKSGVLRRLIDVTPTGEKVSIEDYKHLMEKIKFELGAIAWKCKQLYLQDPSYYDDYIPTAMMSTTNDFFNFIDEYSLTFEEQKNVTLKQAWDMYKEYVEEAKLAYPLSKTKFKEELKNYFEDFKERYDLNDIRCRNVYTGFIIDKFSMKTRKKLVNVMAKTLILDKTVSLLDDILKDCIAQYANDAGTPMYKWDSVKGKVADLDTHKLHYILVPKNHIVIDFDLKDPETGEKSYELNLLAASKFPSTYAEVSKSGKAIHLHYIYEGDVSKLSNLYAPDIEIKVFTGKSALRRKLTYCNDVPIATLRGGLPLKGDKDEVVDFEGIKNEKGLRTLITNNLNKEYHQATKPSMDFIKKILDDAYESGMSYDVSDMKQKVLAFATGSTNHADYCIELIDDIHWTSEDMEPVKVVEMTVDAKKVAPLVFYDVEVFPNLFLVNWKFQGEHEPVVRMINPSPEQIDELMTKNLIGFNCRRYDNHILYARSLGYSNLQLYNLSQKIISGEKNCFFKSAYSVSYTDVYDFASKKQSLKKWEIELGITHKELGLPWDQPVPEELWQQVAEYCDNDVIATEAVFNARQADFTARKILADIAGMTVNDTTNSLTTRIIFGNVKNPQSQFNYRNMGDVSKINWEVTNKMLENFPYEVNREYTVFDSYGRPIFPGYIFENSKSWYRDVLVGEGGYVYAETGIWCLLALLDIASMHPSSIIAELLFGDEFNPIFEDIVKMRLCIKHKDFKKARKLMNGKLAKYFEDESAAKDLAQALKIVINSVYGLTAAKFDNPFRDPRNKDNIVAKRGALFMVNLKNEVEAKGFHVAHVKTDSIKIPDATPEIIDFVFKYGKLYGYTFEHEATYERMCLVDKANYICKYDDEWHATGDKFADPYIFKTLFSHEEIMFEDLWETKEVKTAMYLDLNEDLPDVSAEEKELKKLETKYRKGELSDTTFEPRAAELSKVIETGHQYTFIGRVGAFLPIQSGKGGGLLMRQATNGKYGAVEGTKGYRWLESEYVKQFEMYDDIDMSYYETKLQKMWDEASMYGDMDWFISDEPYIPPQYDDRGAPIYPDLVPFKEGE